MADTNYTLAVGRRKTATARVRLSPAGKTSVMVNGMPAADYFKTKERTSVPMQAFRVFGDDAKTFLVEAKVAGGGVSAQADAVRHGIARALNKMDAGNRAKLKEAGYLTRDPRSVERKKPGLKKARKSPAWSKR